MSTVAMEIDQEYALGPVMVLASRFVSLLHGDLETVDMPAQFNQWEQLAKELLERIHFNAEDASKNWPAFFAAVRHVFEEVVPQSVIKRTDLGLSDVDMAALTPRELDLYLIVARRTEMYGLAVLHAHGDALTRDGIFYERCIAAPLEDVHALWKPGDAQYSRDLDSMMLTLTNYGASLPCPAWPSATEHLRRFAAFLHGKRVDLGPTHRIWLDLVIRIRDVPLRHALMKLLVPRVKDAEELVEHLLEQLDDPEREEAIRELAVRIVKEKYKAEDWNQMTRNIATMDPVPTGDLSTRYTNVMSAIYSAFQCQDLQTLDALRASAIPSDVIGWYAQGSCLAERAIQPNLDRILQQMSTQESIPAAEWSLVDTLVEFMYEAMDLDNSAILALYLRPTPMTAEYMRHVMHTLLDRDYFWVITPVYDVRGQDLPNWPIHYGWPQYNYPHLLGHLVARCPDPERLRSLLRFPIANDQLWTVVRMALATCIPDPLNVNVERNLSLFLSEWHERLMVYPPLMDHPAKGRWAYVYMRNDQLEHVRASGCLSVRSMLELGVHVDELLNKYKQRVAEAQSNPAFQQWLETHRRMPDPVSQLLAYLDWINPATSSAIDFLFAPLPESLRPTNRTLLRFRLPLGVPLFSGVKEPASFAPDDPVYWEGFWERNPKDVPFATIVPASGRIPPEEISLESEPYPEVQDLPGAYSQRLATLPQLLPHLPPAIADMLEPYVRGAVGSQFLAQLVAASIKQVDRVHALFKRYGAMWTGRYGTTMQFFLALMQWINSPLPENLFRSVAQFVVRHADANTKRDILQISNSLTQVHSMARPLVLFLRQMLGFELHYVPRMHEQDAQHSRTVDHVRRALANHNLQADPSDLPPHPVYPALPNTLETLLQVLVQRNLPNDVQLKLVREFVSNLDPENARLQALQRRALQSRIAVHRDKRTSAPEHEDKRAKTQARLRLMRRRRQACG